MNPIDEIQNKKEEKPAKNIIESFPLAYGYAFLVFCGALHFHMYYNTFHIDIFRYLDLSEIAVSFLPIIIVIIIFAGFIIGAFSLIMIIKESSLIKMEPTSMVAKIISKTQNIFSKNIWITVLCFICAGFIFFSYERLGRLSTSIPFSKYRDMYWWSFITFASMVFLFAKDFNHRMTIMLIIFLMAVVRHSISDVKRTIDDAENKTYTIVTANHDTIITNKNHYFVGRTNSYIFLHNSSNSTYEDIPLKDVIKISFKNK
jgi:hypothetical protein